MALLFVSSAGSNTAPYETWAKAATSLQTALTAATSGTDIVVIDKAAVPSGDAEVSVDTTYTFAANCSLISATAGSGSAYTPSPMEDGAWIGNSTTNRGIFMSGAFAVFIYGITLRIGGSTGEEMRLGIDGAQRVYDSCTFWLNTSSGTTLMLGGSSSSSNNSRVEIKNSFFRFGSTGQGLTASGFSSLYNCALHASSSAVSPLFENAFGTSEVILDGCDLSLAGTTIVGSASTSGHTRAVFINCDVPATATWLATQSPLTLASSEVYVFNSTDGDNHFHFRYENALGSVAAVTGKYASGGAKFDGTNGVSWQIDTSSAASYINPFVTPWIDMYHSGTSAITPSLEILRDGSSTAYNNDEVWGEFSYQGTSGSTKATIVKDCMAIGGTPEAQTTGALGAGDWTGEGGTAWFGKLHPTSTITPAEIGMLRARVCVGKPSITVYVDPYIRT